MDAQEVHRTLTANVLSTGDVSAFSIQVLQRTGLTERYRQDRPEALAALHAMRQDTQESEALFALAELSFYHAHESLDRRYAAAALVYAYAYLFPETGPAPDAFDPRLRVAADLYNRSLTRVLAGEEHSEVRLEDETIDLPFGTLEIRFDEHELDWWGRRFGEFVNVADFEVYGLAPRYREPGIGAPIAARLAPGQPAVANSDRRINPRSRVPSSVFLRIAAPRQALETGALAGDLELFTLDQDTHVDVGGRPVRLEFEATSSLAYTLGRSTVWRMGMSGFLAGDFRLFEDQPDDGLMMV